MTMNTIPTRFQRVVLSPYEISESNLTMMHIAKLHGVPARWSDSKNDYELDFGEGSRLKCVYSWTGNDGNIYIEWEMYCV